MEECARQEGRSDPWTTHTFCCPHFDLSLFYLHLTLFLLFLSETVADFYLPPEQK